MSKTCLLLYVLFVALNFNVSLGAAKQDILVPSMMLPGIKAPWLPPTLQAVQTEDRFYNNHAYDYYQTSDYLPHRERQVYNPYEFAKFAVVESGRDGRQTRNRRNFFKKRGGYVVRPYIDMKKKNLNMDSYMDKYSQDAFVIELLRRLHFANTINPTNRNVIDNDPFWEIAPKMLNYSPDDETPKPHLQNPLSSVIKMKRRGFVVKRSAQPEEDSFLDVKKINSKKMITNEKEAFMKQLYYDLFN